MSYLDYNAALEQWVNRGVKCTLRTGADVYEDGSDSDSDGCVSPCCLPPPRLAAFADGTCLTPLAVKPLPRPRPAPGSGDRKGDLL